MRDDLMKMSPWEFDQSPHGWRKFYKDYLKAASLIQQYIKKNRSKIKSQNKKQPHVTFELMNFHIGQLHALAGKKYWSQALKFFKKSYYPKKHESWNAYVNGTIAFLESNPSGIEEAIKDIKMAKDFNKRSINLQIIKNFKKALKLKIKNYKKPYLSWK